MRPEDIEVWRDYQLFLALPSLYLPYTPGEIVTAVGLPKPFIPKCRSCKGRLAARVYYIYDGCCGYECPCSLYPITDPDTEQTTEQHREETAYE